MAGHIKLQLTLTMFGFDIHQQQQLFCETKHRLAKYLISAFQSKRHFYNWTFPSHSLISQLFLRQNAILMHSTQPSITTLPMTAFVLQAPDKLALILGNKQDTTGFYVCAITLDNIFVVCVIWLQCVGKKAVWKGGNKEKTYIQSGHFRVKMLLSSEIS